MTVSITIDSKGLDTAKAVFDPKNYRKAVAAGLRYASSGFNREAAKQIGARYAFPASRIKKDIYKPRLRDDEISITFSRRAPTLRAYDAKPLRKGDGVSYRVFKEGGREQRTEKVFWMPAKMKNGDETFSNVLLPFRRLGPKGRTNVTALFGSSVGSIFARDSRYGEQIRTATLAVVQVQFTKGIDRELARRMRGF
jgi:hypothetical protein